MKVFQNYAEYRAANVRHVPDNGPMGYVCHGCKQTITLPGTVPGFKGGACGYAVTPNNEMLCFPCADADQRESLETGNRCVGYLSADGKSLTTWTGGILGKVTDWNPCKLTRVSYTHGKSYRSVRVTDCHGSEWYGRGSPGIAISLRRIKGA